MGTIINYIKQIEQNTQSLLRLPQIQNRIEQNIQSLLLFQIKTPIQGYARMLAEPLGNMPAYLQKQTAQTKALFKALELSRNSDIKAFVWMINHGWPPLIHVPIKTPTKLMNYCLGNQINRKATRKLLDNEIVSYHNGDMIEKTIVPSWANALISKRRLKILSSAVQAHLDSKYELSVPVLLTQLEGIPSEYFNYAYTTIEKYKEFFVPPDTTNKDEHMGIMF